MSWEVWVSLAGGGVAVALALGFSLAAAGLRRAVWATVAVGLAAGFASAFPLLFPGVTPDDVLPYTLWPRLGYAAAAAACALWALVMVPGGAARSTGGAWAWRGVGVAAFGAGWWCVNPAFADKLPEEIAATLADTHVPFGCAVLAPLCLAVGAWFNPHRRAARWLTRSVAVVAVGGAVFALVELFGALLPPEVVRYVSWREVAVGTGAGVGLCLLTAVAATFSRKPVDDEVNAEPPLAPKPPRAAASPYNLPPKSPAPPPKPVTAGDLIQSGLTADDDSSKFDLELISAPAEPKTVPRPKAPSPLPRVALPPAPPEVKRPTDPAVPDAGSPFSRYIPKPVPPPPPRSRMEFARPPAPMPEVPPKFAPEVVTPPPESPAPPPVES